MEKVLRSNSETITRHLLHPYTVKSMTSAVPNCNGVSLQQDTLTSAVPCNGVSLQPQATDKRHSSGRVFRHVESLTNQLIATDKNFQAIYDVLVIQLVLFLVYVVVNDSIKAGRLYLDISVLHHGIGSIAALIYLECCLGVCAALVYPCFKTWQFIHQTEAIHRTLCGSLFALFYASYVLGSGILVTWNILSLPLPPFSSIIISVEQLRLCMKSYSFIRENAYKVLYPWHKDDQSGPAVWYAGQMSPQVGSFTQYVYFLFAPTLLYRDHYPRNKGPINWRNVVIYLFQFFAAIFYLSMIGKNITFPSSLEMKDLVQCYLSSLLCAFIGFILVQTCVFHGYLNLVSELLRFADREFYLDWWTSNSYSTYYRRWNKLVHDWIHSYVYTDMKSVLKSPLAAVFATTFISAFVHEYLLALALRFASPVLFIEFAGLGVLFYLMGSFRSKRLSNFMVLFGLILGGANLIFYYQVELAARLYCPKKLNWVTFFMPRILECYAKSS